MSGSPRYAAVVMTVPQLEAVYLRLPQPTDPEVQASADRTRYRHGSDRLRNVLRALARNPTLTGHQHAVERDAAAQVRRLGGTHK